MASRRPHPDAKRIDGCLRRRPLDPSRGAGAAGNGRPDPPIARIGHVVIKDLSTQRWFKLATDWDTLLASLSDLRVKMLPVGRSIDVPLPRVDFIEGEPAEGYRHLRRVHYRQDTYCLIDVWLERELFERDSRAFTKAPVLTRLVNMNGLCIAAAKQVVRITVADADTAAFLKIGVGDPVADVLRAVTASSGQIVYCAHIRYPAQLIEIDIDLLPRSARRTMKDDKKKPALATTGNRGGR